MSNFKTIACQNSHQHPIDLTTEGVILLIEDLLQTGLAVRVKVGGRSMQPFLMENEIVTIQKSSPVMLKKGDIVLFVNEGGVLILHRIIRIKKKLSKNIIIQTKGDGLIGIDAPVDASKILGCVYRIEVQKSTNAGRTTFSSINLTLFRHRLIASIIARRELIRYYFYRIQAKFAFARASN